MRERMLETLIIKDDNSGEFIALPEGLVNYLAQQSRIHNFQDYWVQLDSGETVYAKDMLVEWIRPKENGR